MEVNNYNYLSIEKFMEMTESLIDEHKYSDNEKIQQFNIGYNAAIREIRRKLQAPDKDDSGIFMTPYDVFIQTLLADMKRGGK